MPPPPRLPSLAGIQKEHVGVPTGRLARIWSLPVNASRPGGWITLCEGEHDACVLAGLGINAVAVPHGAGTWRAAWGKALAGWSVAVLAHNDEAGLRHAERVRAELGPLVPEVRVGRPPDPFNDAAEMIEAGLRPEHVVTVERPAAAPALTKEEDRRGAEEVLSSSFVRPAEAVACGTG